MKKRLNFLFYFFSSLLFSQDYYNLDSIISRPLVNGNDYRHFYFSPSESNIVSTTNAIWIEGAGSLYMILYQNSTAIRHLL